MTTDARAYRLVSLDALRGLVIIIMALDHVRDALMLHGEFDPTQNPHATPLLFFTRWITHFCAPTFGLLAGISAGLMQGRRSPNDLAAFLAKRGLWLIFVEVAIISPLLAGNAVFGGPPIIIMQVIWAIGASMICLAGLQYLGGRAVLAVGLGILLMHNLLDPFWPQPAFEHPLAPLWVSLHAMSGTEIGGWTVIWAYPILVWIGVLATGFGLAPLFRTRPDFQTRVLVRGGLALVAAFVLLRAANLYGDPKPFAPSADGPVHTLMAFLNTRKYPPSLLYLLMTLGPAAIFAGLAPRLPQALRTILSTYGRAPFAFYVAHFALIRALFVLVGFAQGYAWHDLFNQEGKVPPEFGIAIPAFYLVWIAVVAGLYTLCRWMARLKATRTDWWLSYV